MVITQNKSTVPKSVITHFNSLFKYVIIDCMMSQQNDDLPSLLRQYANTRKLF